MVGENIKRIRKDKRMTQRELAKKMGVTHTVISGYERGTRKPKAETLSRIAEALEVPIWELNKSEVVKTADSDSCMVLLYQSLKKVNEACDTYTAIFKMLRSLIESCQGVDV